MAFDKKSLSERDICTKFITPAIERAEWDIQTQIREEVYFTKGRVIVRGKTVERWRVAGTFAFFTVTCRLPTGARVLLAAAETHHTGF